MNSSNKIVVQNGVCPSKEFDVIAYGDEAFCEAVERNLVSEKAHWDGTTSGHIAVGGQYAVLSEDISKQDVEDISQLHDEDEVGSSIATLDGDGEIVEVEIAGTSDVNDPVV
jgi:hypothetical protein